LSFSQHRMVLTIEFYKGLIMNENLSIMIPRRNMPDLVPLGVSSVSSAKHPALGAIYHWTKNYLCEVHQELGRNGPVCPFVSGSLQRQLLFAAVYEGEDFTIKKIKTTLLHELERFIALDPVSGNEAQFKSLVVLFPDLPADRVAELIDSAQAQLQNDFVPNGLMVGEFHPTPPDKSGLWNQQFRPLYSPVPMLAIRHMVPTDLLFLKNSPRLFHEYVKIFGNLVPERFRDHFDRAALRFGLRSNTPPDKAQGAPRVMAALVDLGIQHRVHSHDDFKRTIVNPSDFADALGYNEARITKTLFMRSQGRKQYCLFVCSVNQRVDLKKIASQLKTHRLELASLDELRTHVNYPPTSVTAIAVDGIPVYIDKTLMRYPTVLTGSGVPRVEIEISPGDLLTLANSKVMGNAKVVTIT
jgi:prolyl-tRNA editing enzyme YbaK/EbsC (Cys-tRNA(Pro) deacylase)